MTPSEPSNFRLDALERSITLMSDRVGEVAKYMERLVVLEERNVYMAEQVGSLKSEFKEAVRELKAQNEALEKKVNDLNEKMIKILTIFSLASAGLAIGAPYVIKALTGGG